VSDALLRMPIRGVRIREIARPDKEGGADIAFERRSRHRHRTAAVTILAIPAFAFVIPFMGALISLATPIVAASGGNAYGRAGGGRSSSRLSARSWRSGPRSSRPAPPSAIWTPSCISRFRSVPRPGRRAFSSHRRLRSWRTERSRRSASPYGGCGSGRSGPSRAHSPTRVLGS
jgi:hypothetical protein